MLENPRAAATEEQPNRDGVAQPAAGTAAQGDVGSWTAIPASTLEQWNFSLLRTAARCYQYPFWNEPLKALGFKPEYLLYERCGASLGYVVVMMFGFALARFGVVIDGPVNLRGDEPLPPDALRALAAWARRQRCVFLRFSHMDNRVLEAIEMAMGRAERLDSFPLYPQVEEDVVVKLDPDEGRMLAGFQRVARRNIRDATAAGFEVNVVEATGSEAVMQAVFEGLTRRKGEGIYNRPLASYLEMVRQAERCGCGRIYLASLKGKPVQVVVVIRTRDLASYVAGALDVEALADATSPACLVHWRAMRDSLSMGVKEYNLGAYGPGDVRVFKDKFRPLQRVSPVPVTVVLKPALWGIWKRVLPLVDRNRDRVRSAAGWLLKTFRVKRGRSASEPSGRSSVG